MTQDSRSHLFCECDLSSFLRSNLEQAGKDVESISGEQFLNSNDDDLIEHVFSMREIIPLELYTDRQELEHNETQIDVSTYPGRDIRDRSKSFFVPGLSVKVTIPFTGDINLWKCRPSKWTTAFPFAAILGSLKEERGNIEITLAKPSDSIGNGSELKREIDDNISKIKFYLTGIRNDVNNHNRELRAHIAQCVAGRRRRLGRHQEIIQVLNIPLKRNPNAPDIEELPIRLRVIKPLFSIANKPPEYEISNEIYEHILRVIRHVGRSFEVTPVTFARLDEGKMRDIILAHLNGHYEGQATGETFRGKGKTDIRIEFESRAAFVAECKVWSGESGLQKAVDQLLGYMIWRDSKGAVIIFNKNVAGFMELRKKVEAALDKYPDKIRGFSSKPDIAEWRYLFKSKEDEERQITLHVFLFNLYVKP